jgi:hypothetical protein
MRRLASKMCEFQTEPPHVKDTLGIGNLEPIFQIVTVGFGCRRVSTHGDTRRALVHTGHYRPDAASLDEGAGRREFRRIWREPA